MGKRTKENYELASQRYLDILNDIHKNPDTIKNLLDSSCRLYRYDFAEQMMIVSANPDAKAVATYDQWNSINCVVKKGSKAIPIATDSGNVKYVFDVAQIKATPYSRMPKEWQIDSSMEERLANRLDKDFGVPKGSYTFADKVMALSEAFAKEMKTDTIDNLVEDGVIGENVPDGFVESVERSMASIMAYSIMKRLDIDTEYYETTGRINFDGMKNLDTDVIATLGTDICTQSGEVLHTIAKEVTQIEFERSMEHERNEISQRGGLSDSEHSTRTVSGRTADVGREIHSESSESEYRKVGKNENERHTSSDRNRGTEVSGRNGENRDRTVDERVRSNEHTTQQQSVGVDGEDESNQGRSGEYDHGRDHLRITSFSKPTLEDGSAPSVPSQAEQLGNILTKMVKNDEMPDEVRSAFQVLYSYMSDEEKGSILAFRELGKENGQPNEKMARTVENSVPVLDSNSDGVTITGNDFSAGLTWNNVGTIVDKDIEQGTFLEESQKEEIIENAQTNEDISEELNLQEFMDVTTYRLNALINTPIPVGTDGTIEKQLRNFSLTLDEDNEPCLTMKYRKYAVDELGNESGLRGFSGEAFRGTEEINKHLFETEKSVSNYLRKDRAFSPIVTIEWSEHKNPLLADDMRMSISQANALFEQVDKEMTEDENRGYAKTKFDIAYQMDNEIHHYIGRQDFGDGDGSLLSHIHDAAMVSVDLLRKEGNTAEADEIEESINIFIPYLEAHSNLSDMEDKVYDIKDAYKSAGADLPEEKEKNMDSLLEYINESRKALNNGETISIEHAYDIYSEDAEVKQVIASTLETKQAELADVTQKRGDLCKELAQEVHACMDEAQTKNKNRTVNQLEKSLLSAKRRTQFLNEIKESGHFSEDRISRLEDMCKTMSEYGKSTHSLKSEIENLENESLSLNVQEKYPQVKELSKGKEPVQIPVKEADAIEVDLGEKTVGVVSTEIKENRDKSVETEPKKSAQDLTSGDRIQYDGKDYSVVGNGLFGVKLEDDKGERISISRNHLNNAGFSSVPDESKRDIANYKIYQLKDGEEYHYQRFESFAQNKDANLNHTDYNEVYSGEIKATSQNATLNRLYEKFNNDRPEDFKGHSLSMSDVIVLSQHNEEKAYYVDRIGFTEFEDFFKEKEVQQEIKDASEILQDAKSEKSKATEMTDFRIADSELGKGTKGEKLRNNLEAIRTLKMVESEDRPATKEEMTKLSNYVGWGGLAEVFDDTKTSYMSERQELKKLLTDDEYKAARHSVLDSYYTSPEIIEAIYDKLSDMGLSSGKMLEPSCGVGNFIGMKPDNMNLDVTGVELDSISGRIASKLYPSADIKVNAFEKTNLPDASFDVAVGNVPFGEIKPNDKQYKNDNLLIHDYFFVKALDKVKSGGVVAFVTSSGTMDKVNSHARELMTQKADFLGAVRLPNNAFKENAGAEVTTDIIFLQKKDVPTIEYDQEFATVGKNDNGISLNQYFVDHPEQICGHMELISSQFGFKAACLEDDGVALSDRMKEALFNIKGTINTVPDIDVAEDLLATPTITDTDESRNYSYILHDDNVYFKADSDICELVTDKDGTAISGKAKDRIVGMCDLRDKTYNLLNIQLDRNTTDAEIKQAQADLTKSYEAFSKKNGRINDRGNALAFREDDSYTLLTSLEKMDDDGKFIGLADIFTKRTVEPTVEVSHADNPHDALVASVNQKACVDLDYMASLCDMPKEDIEKELLASREIFHDTSDGSMVGASHLVTADEYLSGNVRKKLQYAEEMAESYPDMFKANVEELKKVQPQELQASDISVRLGSTWIPPKVIEDFCKEKLDVPARRFQSLWRSRPDMEIVYDDRTSKWNITNKRSVQNAKCTVEFGSEKKNALEVLETTLNLGTPKITYKDLDTGKTVIDEKATKEIMAKQSAMQEEFKNWVFEDPDRREMLVNRYNDLFNNIRPREYDGKNLSFAGMNPSITLNDHQKDAVARQVFGGNTLLAHCVGAGKTFTMAAAGMEMKRVGTCKKPLYVVPKALVGQWAKEFATLYPTAKVLAAGEHDFDPANRKKMTAKIATGNYDAVIISHSQFQKIPLSAEKQKEYIDREIAETMAFLDQNAGEKGFSVRQAEATLDKLQKKAEALTDFDTDSVITFEQLGVDHLFVDESHNYKNLHTDSKLNVSGINKSAAQKSSDMLYKCQYLNEMTDCKGITFATGTPVSNSMSELYVNMKYLQPDILEQMQCTQFDQWAANFGSVVTAMEFDVTGQKFHAKSRFAEFFNLPELMAAFKESADVRTPDMLDLKVPKHNTHTIAVQPSEYQLKALDNIVERCDHIRDGSVNPQEDNMLKVTTDGRLLAFDQRLFDPVNAPDNPNSKINKCVDVAYDIYKNGMEDKCTQMIFSDLGVPPANKGNTEKFNAYQDIKDKLIAKGVPAEEIAIIHEWDSDKKKPVLQSKMRAGEIRFLIGSTQKCGTGLNVQNKLKALHHLDVPWKPSDIEQREGRIIRQGNEYYNKKEPVDIFRYVTEKTFDTYSWQIIEQKQKFVGQIMTSKSPIRSMTDLDNSVIEAATAKAIACGNPKLIEKVNLEKDVDSLKIAKATHTQTRYTMQDMVMKKLPSQIETTQENLRNQLEDMRTYNANKFESTDKSAFHITVAGKEYTDKAEGGMALIDTAKKQMIEHNGMMIGKFKGFPIKVNYDFMQKKGTLTLVGKQNHMVDISTDPHSMIKMMDTQLDRITTDIIPRLETRLTDLQQDLTRTTEEMNKPFPKEEELQEKQKRLDELNEELLADMSDDRKPSDQIEEEKSTVATEKSDLPIEDARKFNMKNFTMEQQEDGKYTLHGDVENNRGGFENMCIRANLTKEEVSQWAAKYGVEVKDESKTIKGAVEHKKEVIEKKGDTPTLGDTEVKREQNAAK